MALLVLTLACEGRRDALVTDGGLAGQGGPAGQGPAGQSPAGQGPAGQGPAGQGGASGEGGASGQPAAGTGGGVAGNGPINECAPKGGGFFPTSRTMGPTLTHYDGPAVVERSTTTELVLAYAAAADPAAGAAAPVVPTHAIITGFADTPVFPVGAKVWFTRDPGAAPLPVFAAPPPNLFVIRDKQGGRILLASSSLGATPIPATVGAQTCSGAYRDLCLTAKITSFAVDVQGDTKVTISDGAVKTVPVGGFGYDISALDFGVTADGSQPMCGDYFGPGAGLYVSMRAQDLSALQTKLETGPAPACSRGNADAKTAIFTFEGVEGFEGPLTYSRRTTAYNSPGLDCFVFTATALLQPGTNVPVAMTVCASRGLLQEPAAGQTFWVSGLEPIKVLRRSKGGPLVIADGYLSADTNPNTVWASLGITAAFVQDCPYSSSPLTFLSKLVVGTTPNVIVRSDDHGLVRLGGQDVDVWAHDRELTMVGR
jgi:hypothetical protein